MCRLASGAACSFLRGAGFRFRRPLSVLRDANCRIAEMDVLFARNGA
jgi:hypothetical protein